jgi:hypothetical protein
MGDAELSVNSDPVAVKFEVHRGYRQDPDKAKVIRPLAFVENNAIQHFPGRDSCFLRDLSEIQISSMVTKLCYPRGNSIDGSPRTEGICNK